MAFKPNMTFAEAQKLKVGDKIDHRNVNGKFCEATITHKTGSRLKLHYDGFPMHLNVECSYINELHRFAELRSISGRPAHRLTHVKRGAFVDINVKQHPGWRKAEVITCCMISGQIQAQHLLDVSGGTAKPIKWKTWVHLDNITEVDSFGVYTATKEINHLPVSLETKRAYLNTPNELIESCAKEVIETVYGGMPHILSLLIANASTSELQQMQHILKQKNIQYQQRLKSKNDKENAPKKDDRNPENTNKLKTKISSLSELSSDSIRNICSYLDREDIKSFKLSSYRNGIVCLNEMTKCNVGVTHCNEIIDDKNDKYVDVLGMQFLANFRYHRYPANMKFSSLQEIWQEKYDIPISKQVLFSGNQASSTYFDTTRNEKHWANVKMRALPSLKFVLFDKRNTIKFDETSNKPKIMDVFDANKQRMIFIKWFDIHFQEITTLQFVCGNHDNMTIGRLTRYIEKEFIVTTTEQKSWYSKLMKYFQKMDNVAPNHNKLIVFQEYEYDRSLLKMNNTNEQLPWWGICIFQLNPTHPVFAKCKFASVQEKHDLLKQ